MQKLKFLLIITTLSACQPESDSLRQKALDAPFIHTAYFWFKEGASEEQLKSFYARSKELNEIPEVEALFMGKPANTTRPIVERSYDYAVVVHLKDLAAHDAYQQHPIHLKLLSDFSGLWEKVMITDIE